MVLKISGLPIGDDYPCFIIAEIGQNHGGDVQLAKELILKAKVIILYF
jgi:sialic acid synthase